ncbi:hypothetical protein [Nonomuraea sediminis]|uniref:hypothetical protein n=1 Tax=Nonomuraea sediminis TaxID=2835864 RepID=UPI001BDCA1D5|nr:hypothetical protein [Nonomuraea sediminis]
MSHHRGDRLHPAAIDFPIDLRVGAWGATPEEVRAHALDDAARFYGDVLPLDVVSAVVEEDPENYGRYIGVIVFRPAGDTNEDR